MLQRIVTHLASLVALIVTILFSGDLGALARDAPVRFICIVFAFVIVLVLVLLDIVRAVKSRDIKYTGADKDEKARRYMTNLVTKNRGRCAISSNALSWVTGDALEAMSIKAKQSKLDVIMPKENDVSNRLEKCGANVYYYGDEKGPLESRFTIVNFERSGQWAAVSHQVDGAHIIRRIRSGADPTLYLAMDLFRMAQRHAKARF